MSDEYLGLRGELDPPAVRLQQRHPDLYLQLRELLRYRGRAIGQCAGDSRQGAAELQLAEQAEPVKIVHRSLARLVCSEFLMCIGQKHSLDRTIAGGYRDRMTAVQLPTWVSRNGAR